MTKKEAAEVISRLFNDSTNENYPFCEEFGTACMIAIQELRKGKTRKDVLLEKFPSAMMNSSDVPKFCAENLGFNIVQCKNYNTCADCWNTEVEE